MLRIKYDIIMCKFKIFFVYLSYEKKSRNR